MEKRSVEEQMSPEVIAQRLGVDVSTVYRWIKKGKFKTVHKLSRKLVRIPASEVNAFLESYTV